MDLFENFLLMESLVPTAQIEKFLQVIPDISDHITKNTRSDSEEEERAYHSMGNEFDVLADFLEENDDPRALLARSQAERSRHPTSNFYDNILRETGIECEQVRYLYGSVLNNYDSNSFLAITASLVEKLHRQK